MNQLPGETIVNVMNYAKPKDALRLALTSQDMFRKVYYARGLLSNDVDSFNSVNRAMDLQRSKYELRKRIFTKNRGLTIHRLAENISEIFENILMEEVALCDSIEQFPEVIISDESVVWKYGTELGCELVIGNMVCRISRNLFYFLDYVNWREQDIGKWLYVKGFKYREEYEKNNDVAFLTPEDFYFLDIDVGNLKTKLYILADVKIMMNDLLNDIGEKVIKPKRYYRRNTLRKYINHLNR